MDQRIIEFDKVLNFRDFGGYDGAGGRKIVPGTFYRSAQFGEASPADMDKLDSLNINVQADLRRPDERERHGHRWPQDGVHVVLSDKGKPSEAPHVHFMSEVSVNAEQAENWMVEYYIGAPYREALVDAYTGWFDALLALNEGAAGVVNCAAGKDRTGILCALTHMALGVDREAVFADYELTNTAANVEARLPAMAKLFNENSGLDYDADVYRPFIGVRPIYLDAALTSIEARSGSVEAYLADTLGVSAAKVDQLRGRYLA
ncbi:MAG: tyrosine-protein phosphatase [Pseudomonadota bacterium]